MNVNLHNFESHNEDIYDLCIRPIYNDVSGGKLTNEEIDIIKKYPNAKSLRISGLNQETFEYLITNYGYQFEALSFFKNKMVSDLSLLGNLRQIRYIYYFFNQKVTKLWNMKNNEKLEGLALYDFSKLCKIDEIATAPMLKKFAMGNEVWSKSCIESLKPLANSTVTHFAWWGDKVADNDYSCLADSVIDELDLNIRNFKMKELAELVASIPNLKGSATKPYREITITNADKASTTYYYLCKGKKTLTKGKDNEKLEKYLFEFEKLIAHYKG